VSSAPLFLIGAVVLAAVGSLLVWLVSRPRQQVNDPHELRNTLRNLSRGHHDYRPTSDTEASGMRVLPREEQPGSSGGRPENGRNEHGDPG
jgi:hypothetical protein